MLHKPMVKISGAIPNFFFFWGGGHFLKILMVSDKKIHKDFLIYKIIHKQNPLKIPLPTTILPKLLHWL